MREKLVVTALLGLFFAIPLGIAYLSGSISQPSGETITVLAAIGLATFFLAGKIDQLGKR